jgi:hypothetical protein
MKTAFAALAVILGACTVGGKGTFSDDVSYAYDSEDGGVVGFDGASGREHDGRVPDGFDASGASLLEGSDSGSDSSVGPTGDASTETDGSVSDAGEDASVPACDVVACKEAVKKASGFGEVQQDCCLGVECGWIVHYTNPPSCVTLP